VRSPRAKYLYSLALLLEPLFNGPYPYFPQLRHLGASAKRLVHGAHLAGAIDAASYRLPLNR
jgi:hypothetical protein